jgi:hypothetical protein
MLCFEISISTVPWTRILVCFALRRVSGESSRIRWRMSVCALVNSVGDPTRVPRLRLGCDDGSVGRAQVNVFDIEQR